MKADNPLDWLASWGEGRDCFKYMEEQGIDMVKTQKRRLQKTEEQF